MTILTPSQTVQPPESVNNQPAPVYYQPEAAPKKKRSHVKRWILLAVLLIFLIFFLPFAINGTIIAFKAVDLSQRVDNITQAAEQNDWLLIKSELGGGSDDLSAIGKGIGGLGPILWIPPLGQSARVSQKMVTAAGELLDGYGEALVILEQLRLQTADPTKVIGQIKDAQQKKTLLQAIADNQEALDRARIKIEESQKTIASINTRDFNGIFKGRLMGYNQTLSEVIANSEMALPIFKNLPELVGRGQSKTYLFVFQNNMEMRPTGGFIGSYGLLTFKDGEITDLFTDDVYNLDKLSEGQLTMSPPQPLQKYMGQKYWFLRDANWYADWPTSAKNIIWFFDRERQLGKLPYQRLDGVIALSPDFIANLLKVVGPVTVDGVTFSDQNFAMELEKEVERNYIQRGISKEQRKSIIGPLTRELISRMENSSLPKMLQSWLAFKKNIDEKQILVYLTDPKTQGYFADQNWAGSLKYSESDYLLAIDANMAAMKTDSVMKKSVSYRLAERDGKLIGRAELTYEHTSERVEYFIREYRDYLQLYVPEGSRPLSALWSDQTGEHSIDVKSGLETRNEFGKTVFAYFFTVEPKSTRTIVIEYELPAKVLQLYRQGKYKLIVQKQPGTAGHVLQVDLNFNRYFNAYHSEIFPETITGKRLLWKSDLSIDREFTVGL